MFRTFILGLILGFFGAGATLHFVPLVDQHRVPSHVSVQTNGGNSEDLRINLPGDRILAGQPGSASPIPPGLSWPESPMFAGFEAELFKIRDRDETVIGIGSRLAQTGSGDKFVQWVIHLPARGTMIVAMEPDPAPGRVRTGKLESGTGEFARLRGSISEAFVRAADGEDAEQEGRINLRLALVGPQEDAQ